MRTSCPAHFPQLQANERLFPANHNDEAQSVDDVKESLPAGIEMRVPHVSLFSLKELCREASTTLYQRTKTTSLEAKGAPGHTQVITADVPHDPSSLRRRTQWCRPKSCQESLYKKVNGCSHVGRYPRSPVRPL